MRGLSPASVGARLDAPEWIAKSDTKGSEWDDPSPESLGLHVGARTALWDLTRCLHRSSQYPASHDLVKSNIPKSPRNMNVRTCSLSQPRDVEVKMEGKDSM